VQGSGCRVQGGGLKEGGGHTPVFPRHLEAVQSGGVGVGVGVKGFALRVEGLGFVDEGFWVMVGVRGVGCRVYVVGCFLLGLGVRAPG